jgi:hypothetical protein
MHFVHREIDGGVCHDVGAVGDWMHGEDIEAVAFGVIIGMIAFGEVFVFALVGFATRIGLPVESNMVPK